MWPSNKDIPLFIGVPIVMNDRVYVMVILLLDVLTVQSEVCGSRARNQS